MLDNSHLAQQQPPNGRQFAAVAYRLLTTLPGPRRASPISWGTSGAHRRKGCPRVMRIGEISTAGRMVCPTHPLRSGRPWHKTRPTGRLPDLAPECQGTIS